MSSLLPKNRDEFHSKDYWDRFFKERGQKAFEWYGSYSDIELVLKKYVRATERFLVIGCGNSNFSSDFYDQGFQNIVNLDFSELVIQEMRNKNKSRVSMLWNVGDMTNLIDYADKSMDIVIDKGALDALMSENTQSVKDKAFIMFNEIERVLQDNGKYICVSLAQDYILDTLLSYFMENSSNPISTTKWCITVELIRSSAPSPFKPFFFLISKVKNPTSPLAGIMRLTIDNLGNLLVKPITSQIQSVKDILSSIQGFSQKQYELSIIQPGRFDNIEIYSTNSSSYSNIPRYTLLIVDLETKQKISCAVFFIPQGREHEYLFSTFDGLESLAKQAGCTRLISVRLHRPYHYGSTNAPPDSTTLNMADVQAELSPIIIPLAPIGTEPGSIPYMSIGGDSSWIVCDQGWSSISGEYIIEESFIQEKYPREVIRRLVFLQNQNFIQTEAKLIEGKSEGEFEYDLSYLDPHHVACLAAFLIQGTIISQCSKLEDVSSNTGTIIGLGGGAFVMCIQKYLPGMLLNILDIDEALPSIASKHFGFKLNDKGLCNIVIQDGLEYIKDHQQEMVSFLYIDADSKDASMGISAPPVEFISKSALQLFYSYLSPGGLLVMNVVARKSSMLSELVNSVKEIFQSTGNVFLLRPSEETVNVALIAVKEINIKLDASLNDMWLNRLKTWLSDIGLSSDPLSVASMIDLIKVQ